MPGHRRRLLIAALCGFGALLARAAPAGAVSVRPTDERSTVESVTPSAPLTVRVIGGDALLELRADPGHEVIVEGYDQEPYLRIAADGTVSTNRRSPATYLNQTRDASAPVPEGVSSAAAPDWEVTGSDGTVIWHDHRIHAGPGSSGGAPGPWAVPLVVDGSPVVVHGRLEHLEPPSPVPWVLVAAASAALTWWAARRRPLTGSAIAVVGAAGVAGITGWAEWQSVPAAAGRNAGLWLLPVAAAILATVSLCVRPPMARVTALVASVALLAGWVAFRWSILTRAVLVSTLAPALDRAGLAVVAGVLMAAAGLAVSGAGEPGRSAKPVAPADRD